MRREEYEKICKELTEEEIKKHFFYVPIEEIETRKQDSNTESNIRKNQTNAEQVAKLTRKIRESGDVNPVDGTPVNNVPACITPKAACQMSYDFEHVPTKENGWDGATLDDGAHRDESVPKCGGTHLFVSDYKSSQDPSGVERRINSMVSNDYDQEGLPHDECDDEKNVKHLTYERYFLKSHGIKLPLANDEESRDAFLEEAADVLEEKLPNMYDNRGRRTVKRWMRDALVQEAPGNYAKETNKKKIYQSVCEGNPHGWTSEKLDATDGVKEIVVCPDGIKRKTAIVTSATGIRKDALPNVFSSKTTNPAVEVTIFAGLGNKTAVTNLEIHKFRMECIREYLKFNGSSLLAPDKRIFDNILFQKQINSRHGKLVDPPNQKWLTIKDVVDMDKKLYPEKYAEAILAQA